MEEVVKENEEKENASEKKQELEEAKEDAKAELKNMKEDAIDAVKKMVTKQESEEGGIVDTITKVFADHAKKHETIR